MLYIPFFNGIIYAALTGTVLGLREWLRSTARPTRPEARE
jgi:hypothetical protein